MDGEGPGWIKPRSLNDPQETMTRAINKSLLY